MTTILAASAAAVGAVVAAGVTSWGAGRAPKITGKEDRRKRNEEKYDLADKACSKVADLMRGMYLDAESRNNLIQYRLYTPNYSEPDLRTRFLEVWSIASENLSMSNFESIYGQREKFERHLREYDRVCLHPPDPNTADFQILTNIAASLKSASRETAVMAKDCLASYALRLGLRIG
ncbi:hypothetical protein [Streptomyces cadmiisoli]|uniref:hypothetical protein n=1 Tax=Streptomyces cadmiisoli TaxID=2184053 RepID=UPI0013A6F316|nr:hypothetical protein [Streptomyces cadmiisoli]